MNHIDIPNIQIDLVTSSVLKPCWLSLLCWSCAPLTCHMMWWRVPLCFHSCVAFSDISFYVVFVLFDVDDNRRALSPTAVLINVSKNKFFICVPSTQWIQWLMTFATQCQGRWFNSRTWHCKTALLCAVCLPRHCANGYRHIRGNWPCESEACRDRHMITSMHLSFYEHRPDPALLSITTLNSCTQFV